MVLSGFKQKISGNYGSLKYQTKKQVISVFRNSDNRFQIIMVLDGIGQQIFENLRLLRDTDNRIQVIKLIQGSDTAEIMFLRDSSNRIQ